MAELDSPSLIALFTLLCASEAANPLGVTIPSRLFHWLGVIGSHHKCNCSLCMNYHRKEHAVFVVVSTMAAAAPAARVGLVKYLLPKETAAPWLAWREAWLRRLPTHLRDKVVATPKPHVTLFFGCTPEEDVVRDVLETHGPVRVTLPSDRALRCGEVSPVVLAELDSPSLVALFTSLYTSAATNPLGTDTPHALFARAKRPHNNAFGFVPHLTVCWFAPDVDMESLVPFLAPSPVSPRPALRVDLPPIAAVVKSVGGTA